MKLVLPWAGRSVAPLQALADPYFKGLAKVEREPSAQPITKVEFEFERRRLNMDDVRELIYREVRACPSRVALLAGPSNSLSSPLQFWALAWSPVGGCCGPTMLELHCQLSSSSAHAVLLPWGDVQC